MAPPRLLKARNVAPILGVSKRRVYGLVSLGILPAIHLGKSIRFDASQLERFFANGGKKFEKFDGRKRKAR